MPRLVAMKVSEPSCLIVTEKGKEKNEAEIDDRGDLSFRPSPRSIARFWL